MNEPEKELLPSGAAVKARKSKYAHLPPEERKAAAVAAFKAKHPDYRRRRLNEGFLVKGHGENLTADMKAYQKEYRRTHYIHAEPKPFVDYAICPQCGDERFRTPNKKWRCRRCFNAAAKARRLPGILAKKEARKEKDREDQEKVSVLRALKQEALRPVRVVCGIPFTQKRLDKFPTLSSLVGGCLEWRDLDSEGEATYNGKPAWRVSYALHFGAIPAGKNIYRTCGNARCVLPEHLEAKTQEERDGDWKERFMSRVEKGSGCWEWKGQKSPAGYGEFKLNSRNHRAHRLSYLIHNGSIENTLSVHHSCDNPGCVNPEHLSQGDQMKNMKEAKERDRVAFGARNAQCRHSTETVREIVLRRIAGESCSKIGEALGLNTDYVKKVICGRDRARETADLRGELKSVRVR